MRLWVLGARIDAEEASLALAPAGVDELEEAGLVTRDRGGAVGSTIAIRPHGHLVVASDRATATLDEPPDLVPGPNPVARILARHTIRLPARSALDLATGMGVQALAAARHAKRVLATDINARALAFAHLNARLNGFDNIRLAEGTWFDPVGEEAFDLIVANIPFVISPDSDFLYRDSGMGPGEASAMVVAESARRLTDGGFAHVMCEWGVGAGEEWSDRVRAWVAATGCDAVVLCHDVVDPVMHATAWSHRLLAVAPQAFEEAVERWTRHHRGHGHVAIASATVVLRKSDGGGDPWVAAHRLDASTTGEAGDHVLRLFSAEDLLRAMPEPAGLLARRLRTADLLRIEQVLTMREERWRHRPSKLRVRPGLGIQAEVEPDLLPLIFALDGRPVEVVVRELADRRGEDEAALRERAAAQLPELVRLGLLVDET